MLFAVAEILVSFITVVEHHLHVSLYVLEGLNLFSFPFFSRPLPTHFPHPCERRLLLLLLLLTALLATPPPSHCSGCEVPARLAFAIRYGAARVSGFTMQPTVAMSEMSVRRSVCHTRGL